MSVVALHKHILIFSDDYCFFWPRRFKTYLDFLYKKLKKKHEILATIIALDKEQ